MKEAMAYCQEKGYRGFVANQALYNIASKAMKPYPDDTMVIMDDDTLRISSRINCFSYALF